MLELPFLKCGDIVFHVIEEAAFDTTGFSLRSSLIRDVAARIDCQFHAV
jgi:hypothetical protein